MFTHLYSPDDQLLNELCSFSQTTPHKSMQWFTSACCGGIKKYTSYQVLTTRTKANRINTCLVGTVQWKRKRACSSRCPPWAIEKTFWVLDWSVLQNISNFLTLQLLSAASILNRLKDVKFHVFLTTGANEAVEKFLNICRVHESTVLDTITDTDIISSLVREDDKRLCISGCSLHNCMTTGDAKEQPLQAGGKCTSIPVTW